MRGCKKHYTWKIQEIKCTLYKQNLKPPMWNFHQYAVHSVTYQNATENSQQFTMS